MESVQQIFNEIEREVNGATSLKVIAKLLLKLSNSLDIYESTSIDDYNAVANICESRQKNIEKLTLNNAHLLDANENLELKVKQAEEKEIDVASALKLEILNHNKTKAEFASLTMFFKGVVA